MTVQELLDLLSDRGFVPQPEETYVVVRDALGQFFDPVVEQSRVRLTNDGPPYEHDSDAATHSVAIRAREAR